MKSVYVAATRESFLDPGATCWHEAKGVRLEMAETPLDMQPTEAIKAQWRGRKHGMVKQVTLDALHNGQQIAFRLHWQDPHENRTILDNDQFVDGAAIMLPAVTNAPIILMGQPGAPVNAWYWRADEGKAGRHIVAEGYGSTRTVDRSSIVCSSHWAKGSWTVVITRALTLSSPATVAQLYPGARTPYGVAIWEGGNQERAGIKSFTLSREDLILDPAR